MCLTGKLAWSYLVTRSVLPSLDDRYVMAVFLWCTIKTFIVHTRNRGSACDGVGQVINKGGGAGTGHDEIAGAVKVLKSDADSRSRGHNVKWDLSLSFERPKVDSPHHFPEQYGDQLSLPRSEAIPSSHTTELSAGQSIPDLRGSKVKMTLPMDGRSENSTFETVEARFKALRSGSSTPLVESNISRLRIQHVEKVNVLCLHLLPTLPDESIQLASAVGKIWYKYGCLDVSPDVGYKDKHRQGQRNSHAIFPMRMSPCKCKEPEVVPLYEASMKHRASSVSSRMVTGFTDT
ncbi:hypothetical protein ARMGADRAFT_1067130 [Armillaria gallica]|uniref:Uncharacterized protein n=1 Tax=Armillaria gallica TaxID=47427 RepID=A0A2H3CPI1_ARMGA|nr:hypothetical protein ARMGADRAFT_1067130 [Armillaria gallica]